MKVALAAGILCFEHGLTGKDFPRDDIAVARSRIGGRCGEDDLGGDDIGY